jgi:hypothetical protein
VCLCSALPIACKIFLVQAVLSCTHHASTCIDCPLERLGFCHRVCNRHVYLSWRLGRNAFQSVLLSPDSVVVEKFRKALEVECQFSFLSPPYIANNSLTTRFDINMLNGHFLLSLTTMFIECFKLGKKCSG